MKVLVVGSGGREHAICYKFAQSSRVVKIYCAPGNAGIAGVAECVQIPQDDIAALADFATGEQIDLTFVGGEGPLALGIADEFQKNGLKIIGASKSAARLEASKAFAKDFMLRHGVPTAHYYNATSSSDAIEKLEAGHFGAATEPVVVKADGLAAGKGVVVARDRGEAVTACRELESVVGRDAVDQIVLEEFLDGREVSLIMFADRTSYSLMPPVRDHKRIGEGDTGPNTGGMGTITDESLLTAAQTQQIAEEIIEPTLSGCIAEGFPFRGILFLGLMMTPGGPKLLEYNVRFGDPETQSIMVRLETDIADICEAMLAGTLDETQISWTPGNSACVVLASEGYPQKARTGDMIVGLDEVSTMGNVVVFHASTANGNKASGAKGEQDGVTSSYLTAGGRVLGVTAIGSTLDQALTSAYSAVGKISWSGMQYRRDIGR